MSEESPARAGGYVRVSQERNARDGYGLDSQEADVGIEEKKDAAGVRTAHAVVGLGNAETAVQKAEQWAAAWIMPRLSGLRVRVVRCPGIPAAVVVIRAPSSLDAPHMAQGRDRFYIRMGARHTQRMTAAQVRHACLRNHEVHGSARERLRGLIEAVGRDSQAKFRPCAVSLLAVPLTAGRRVVDVQHKQLRKLLVDPLKAVSRIDDVRPCLEGLSTRCNMVETNWAQVYRDGALVHRDIDRRWSGSPSQPGNGRLLPGVDCVQAIDRFLSTFRMMRDMFSLFVPALFAAVLEGVQSSCLATSNIRPLSDVFRSSAMTDRDCVEVTMELSDRFDQAATLRAIADLMWNAWGMENAGALFDGSTGKPRWWKDESAGEG